MRKTLLGAALLAAVAMTGCDASGETPEAPDGGAGGAAPAVTTPAADPTTAPPTTAPPTAAPPTTAPPAARKPRTTPPPPASFDPARDITDLAASTPGLVLREPVDGVRHGRLAVTITNNGPNAVWGLTFSVELPESVSADGGDWGGCTPLGSREAGYPAGSICAKGYLAPGRSRTFQLGVKSPAAKDGADSTVSRWLVDVWSGGKGGAQYRDRAPDDNRKIFSITRR